MKTTSVHEKVLILPVQLMDHWGFPVSPHHHLLLLQLFCHLDDSEQHDSFKTQTVLNLTHNATYSNSGYNLHLSQRSPRLQSRFWRKRHMIRAWRQCRWLHGLGRPEQSQMTQGERGSNRVHLQGRHGLDHLTMCPTNKEKNTPLMGRKLLWHLGLTKVNDFEIKLKLNRKVCFNAYLQTKYRAD